MLVIRVLETSGKSDPVAVLGRRGVPSPYHVCIAGYIIYCPATLALMAFWDKHIRTSKIHDWNFSILVH